MIALTRGRIRALARGFDRDETASLWARGERRLKLRLAARRARGAFYLTRGELRWLGEWKSPRIRPQIVRNTEAGVRGLTAAAFLAQDDGMRLRVLLGLRGVGVAVASVVLHFAHPGRYPIYDVRVRAALRRMGMRQRSLRPGPGGRRTRLSSGSSRPSTACRSGPSTRRSGVSEGASRVIGGRRQVPRRGMCYAGAAAAGAARGRAVDRFRPRRALTVRPSARRTMGLRYEQQDRVVTITLDRPEAMNAVDPEMHRDLIDAWTRFRDDPEAWVAILTGAGEKAFCAGADLKKMIPQAFGSPGAGRSHNDLGLGGITRGLQIWKPIVAAVNGYALAGGLELMLSCDVRVAAEHAVFGLTEVRWAIMPGAGGTQRLPRAVPLAKAMEMILMGETCSAQEAHRIGLVNAVVPAPEVLPTARRWAQTLCERGPLAVRAAKEAIVRGLSLPLADGLRLEAFLSGTLRGTEDAAEGPKAFAEKRKPVFRAR